MALAAVGDGGPPIVVVDDISSLGEAAAFPACRDSNAWRLRLDAAKRSSCCASRVGEEGTVCSPTFGEFDRWWYRLLEVTAFNMELAFSAAY